MNLDTIEAEPVNDTQQDRWDDELFLMDLNLF